MKGFSLFAPVLGAMLVVAAMSTAAFISKEEAKKRADIDAMAAKIYLNALPEALKWDAVSSYITALRDWFYDAYVYTPGALRNPPKKDIADTMISYIGNDENAPWLILSNMAYRYYVKGDPKDLADIMDVTTDRKKIYVKISADMGKVPLLHVDLNIGRGGGQSENLDIPLFTSEVGFPIYYPAEEIENNIDRIKKEAEKHYFVAGILPESVGSNDAVAVIGDGTNVIEKMGTWGDKSDLNILTPAKDAYYAFPENENNAESEYINRNAVDDAVREWLESIGMTNVQVWSIPEYEGKDGIPYFRLICVEGDLADLLTGGSGEVCVKVPEGESVYEIDREYVPYVKIKKVVVEGTITASSKCAPSSKQTVNARVKAELNFGGSESIKKGAKLEEATVKDSDYVINDSDTYPCRSAGDCDNDNQTEYDCSGALDKAKKECETDCMKYSNYLKVSQCEDLCNNYAEAGDTDNCSNNSSTNISWHIPRSAIREEILENLKTLSTSDPNKKDRVTLLKIFGNKFNPNNVFKPEIENSEPALISKTILTVRKIVNGLEARAEAKVCVTNSTC